jgi:hypothetical protein
MTLATTLFDPPAPILREDGVEDKGGDPGFAALLKVGHALGFRRVPEPRPA